MRAKGTIAYSAAASLVAVLFGAVQPASAAIADWQYWAFGDPVSYVVALTDPAEPDYPYTASELVTAGEAYASFPLADGLTFADYEYMWYQGDEASCSSTSSAAIGSFAVVPDDGVIALPGSFTGPIWLMIRETGNFSSQYYTRSLFTGGSAPVFCQPNNVSLNTATSGSLSIQLTFDLPVDLPASLADANIDISAYAFPAGTAVPSDVTSSDANYPHQVGCTLNSCTIMGFDAIDVGVEFDFVYRAMWWDGSSWSYAPWDVARVAVSPGEEQQQEYDPPQLVEVLSKPIIDISGGTAVGDTVGILQDAVWDTQLPNDSEGNMQFTWLYAETCDSQRWYSFRVNGEWAGGETFTIPAEITIEDFTDPMNPTQVSLSTSGLKFNMVSSYFNIGENLMGNAISQSAFEVGGGYCTAVTLYEDNASTSDVVRAAPYRGPVITTPAISGAPAGGKLKLAGSNLEGVTGIEIGGHAATVSVNSDGEIEITVPAGLAAGTYDLVITSDSGKLTIQDGITVTGTVSPLGVAAPSTKRMVDNTAKVWVFDVAGAGKVQIFVNGEEIAWVRTDDPNDAKLKDGYLVRTVDLEPGKNVIEIYVDGQRVRRTAYSN